MPSLSVSLPPMRLAAPGSEDVTITPPRLRRALVASGHSAFLLVLCALATACGEESSGEGNESLPAEGPSSSNTPGATGSNNPVTAPTDSTCPTPPCSPTPVTSSNPEPGNVGDGGGSGTSDPTPNEPVPNGAGGGAGGVGDPGAGGSMSSAGGNGPTGGGGEPGASGSSNAAGAGGTPTEGEPEPEPEGPPDGAYVACSGDPLPALQLTTVLEGLDEPTFAVTPAGDAQTMFVTERTGALLRFDLSQDDPAPTTILDLDTSRSAECGFLAVALHPNFDGVAENRLYVSYNPTCPLQIFGSGGSSALDEYVVDGDSATFSQSFFEVSQPEGNHNGGGIAFGPDGYLYLGLGDGGGSNDEHGDNGNGQNPNTPLGALLRFDVDAVDTPPAGNLTSEDVGGASVDGRIRHFGLRNPWRFSFDRQTGDLYIGDVGQNTTEEANIAPAGSGPLNFGWAAREGNEACPTCNNKSLLAGSSAVDPIHTHPRGGGGSSTGGYVYRGQNIPGMYGRYIYGDYATGDMWVLTHDGQGGACDVVENVLPNTLPADSLVSFAEDADGELYIINMSRGTISRIDPG